MGRGISQYRHCDMGRLFLRLGQLLVSLVCWWLLPISISIRQTEGAVAHHDNYGLGLADGDNPYAFGVSYYPLSQPWQKLTSAQICLLSLMRCCGHASTAEDRAVLRHVATWSARDGPAAKRTTTGYA